jgi:hypothetical protein
MVEQNQVFMPGEDYPVSLVKVNEITSKLNFGDHFLLFTSEPILK